jgi:hypothetical protein
MAESRLADRPPEFWEEVGKEYYGTSQPVLALCQKHDLTLGEFNAAKAQLGWRRRKVKKVSRDLLISRLFRLLDQNIKQLEDEMTTTGHKEVMVLNHLANTLGKLIEIEASAGKIGKPRQTKDMHDIRRKLVERIENLKRN